MGVNYYIACNKCQTCIAIGKKGPAGFSFWSGEKKNMAVLRSMLETCCLEHVHALCFLDENDPRLDDLGPFAPRYGGFKELPEEGVGQGDYGVE